MRLCLSFAVTVVTFTYSQALEARQSDWRVGQTVSTSSGQVTGHDAGNNNEVSEYLGIPYAKPPVGNLRFAAPEKFESNAPINATKFAPSCYATPGSNETATPEQLLKANLTSQVKEIQTIYTDNNQPSEDCLYLNVWTKPQVGERKKAVMVWIYGGAFTFGSTSITAYSGRNFAALEDVVVVSMNYRLNIFGFPAHPNGTYNVGILDQRLALEWVRDNIEKFGGDASRITLFGQSAGSASVDYHSYAWATDPIAKAYILQSGTVFSWGLPNSQSMASKAWFTTSKNLGCGDAFSPQDKLLSCMRTKSPDDIYKAFPVGLPGSILGPFVPTVDNTVIFSNYSDRKPANLPVLVGNNDYEGGLFRTEYVIKGIILTDTFWTDFNLNEFTCPSSDRANASLAIKAPLWRYRYMGVFPNLELSPYSGSWHAAEVPLLFNEMPKTSPSTPFEVYTAKYMRGAWSAFAKNPTNGLIEYGWPMYDPTKDTLVRIGNNNSEGSNLINPYRYDADCIFFNVSSTDPSQFGVYPDLGAGITPTGTFISSPTSGPSKSGPDATNTGMLSKPTDKSSGYKVSSIRPFLLIPVMLIANAVLVS
ncbi:putative carboxylesterase [Erysiphe necator]|uniref:Carboxylic ester hydrolase n=1 Tax=Uncinula necator TaxID=52586 RepID=A0A0B1P5K9_UNCNE|nr:putative carboxylesterase [Erysiphe necator]